MPPWQNHRQEGMNNLEDLDKILLEVVRKTVKETLETIMNTERDMFIEKNDGTKNGTYRRTFNTKYGFIDDLRVTRDREGNFKTMIIRKIYNTV